MVTEANEKQCVLIAEKYRTEIISLDSVVLAPDPGQSSKEKTKQGTYLTTHTMQAPKEEKGVEVDSEQHTMDRIMYHEEKKDGTNWYRVRWNSYGAEENKLEQIRSFPRSNVMK